VTFQRALLGAAALAAVLLSACGGNSDSGADVRSIDEISVAPLEVVDIGAQSAVVSLDTTVDVVCSVVYGTDTSYGMQATDTDMMGTGHDRHRPTMRGLEPDTLYHFRVQGTAADGAVYVSDDMTFRTAPERDGAGATGTNLASTEMGARVVDVSSAFGNSESWSGENASDGDPASEWSSQGDGDGAFIVVELAEQSALTSIGLWTRTMGTSAQIEQFRVVTDGGRVLGPFDVPDASGMHVYPVSAEARQLRFEVTASSGGNTGVVELAAFAEE
jgi:hypothetical protein